MTNPHQILVLAAHAFGIWVLCFATIGIGMKVASERTALIVHAVAAPVFSAAASIVYYTWFGSVAPILTALFFLVFIVATDFFVVALMILRSLDMFRSFLGTWLPFLLIFCAAYLAGMLIGR